MKKEIMILTKANAESSHWLPLEQGTVEVLDARAARVVITDSVRRCYLDMATKPGAKVTFQARGNAGVHALSVLDDDDAVLGCTTFELRPRTRMSCDKGPYCELGERIKTFLEKYAGVRPLIINNRLYRMLVTWGRDHVYTLKAQKYFMEDVKSGLDYWLDTQEPNGMVWDCIHPNPNYPHASWFGEALGEEYNRYEDNMRYVVRRIPVEADCEFLYTEGVWYAWKASGDDAWMAKQLPRLEKALTYNSSHPARWSRKHRLVRRSFCMDSWDFVNPHYCNGDHRCINPGDPQFLFHSDNSGLYASYWRMAEMYEHLGNRTRAKQLRAEGEKLRSRANKKLFFGANYGHMIPETLPEKEVYALVGDERKRMSLSTGYTINRKMPTHEMAVKILKEYQRRGKAKRKESFAEWWTMDPPYMPGQWGGYSGTGGSRVGEYMNGAICSIVAGELAKAAFDHGMEEYGADILERLWKLIQRDNGYLFQVYRRLPENPKLPPTNFQFVDLRSIANRGLRNGAHPDVEAWTGEGDNDMRNLPVGKQTFGAVQFDVIDPDKSDGRSVVRLSPDGAQGPSSVTIPVNGLTGESIYFLHATASAVPKHTPAAVYEVMYADGTSERVWIRSGHEIGLWWGLSDAPDLRRGKDPVDRSVTRIAWNGPNGTWKNVGMFMNGWNNPHPEKPVVAVRVEALPSGGPGGLLLGGISFSDQPVQFEVRIRSHGLPDCWAQAAVYYAIAEGLCGIEDTGRAFDTVRISPRWVSSEARTAEVTLHYPSSDGYCTYRYGLDVKRRRIKLDMAGSFERARLHCLLPKGAVAKRVQVDGENVPFTAVRVERSNYVDFDLEGIPTEPVVIEYSPGRR